MAATRSRVPATSEPQSSLQIDEPDQGGTDGAAAVTEAAGPAAEADTTAGAVREAPTAEPASQAEPARKRPARKRATGSTRKVGAAVAGAPTAKPARPARKPGSKKPAARALEAPKAAEGEASSRKRRPPRPSARKTPETAVAQAAPEQSGVPDWAAETRPPFDDKPRKKRQKLVRDSFTMPKSDHRLIDALKTRCLTLQRATKKSELLRAGLHALSALGDRKLIALLEGLEPLKSGRPKKS
ncbi:MAG: hypothetical protein H6934_04850 [Burkholderiaceae bacterium]|nr:hypothetical protein [Burkholderiaceae bacterium]